MRRIPADAWIIEVEGAISRDAVAHTFDTPRALGVDVQQFTG